MGIYIIPIFCFGLVITGIVFLGIRQASDLAIELEAQNKDAKPDSDKSPVATPGFNGAGVRPVAGVRHS